MDRLFVCCDCKGQYPTDQFYWSTYKGCPKRTARCKTCHKAYKAAYERNRRLSRHDASQRATELATPPAPAGASTSDSGLESWTWQILNVHRRTGQTRVVGSEPTLIAAIARVEKLNAEQGPTPSYEYLLV